MHKRALAFVVAVSVSGLQLLAQSRLARSGALYQMVGRGVASDRVSVLRGRLVNAITGEPVSKARVRLYPFDARSLKSQGMEGLAYSATDEQGAFTFTGISPGAYRLSAERSGFVTVEYGARGAGRRGTPLVVDSGVHIIEIVFKMIPHCVISGRVFNEDSEPVVGALVNVLRPSYASGKRQLRAVKTTGTNDRGEYRLFGLEPGRYWISASPPPEAITVETGDALYVGTLQSRAARQDSEHYVLTFYPGTEAGSGVPVEIAAGSQTGGIDFRMLKARSVRVRGRVVNQTGLVAAPTVLLMPGDPSYGPPNIARPILGADGQFEFRGLTAGRYTLSVVISQGSDSYSVHHRIDVGSQNLEGVVVAVGRGVDLSGVIEAEGAERFDLAQLGVSLQLADPPPLTPGRPLRASVNPDGKFWLRGVGPDQYVVTVSGLPEGSYVRAIDLGPQDVLERGLDLSSSGGGQLRIVVSGKPGNVQGIVLAEEGGRTVVPGSTVVLVPESDKRRAFARFFRAVVADEKGKFSIPDVHPGSYRAYAWDDIEPGSWLDESVIAPIRAKGKTLSIRQGSRETLELTVIR